MIENEKVKKLDVREIDGPPFYDIMDALEELEEREILLLINSFEPVPLYKILELKGFTYDTTQIQHDLWTVKITKNNSK